MTVRRPAVLIIGPASLAVLVAIAMTASPRSRADDGAPSRPRPPVDALRVADVIDQPYAQVTAWPMPILPGLRSDAFVPLDVALDGDGRRYIADDQRDVITVEDPVTGAVTDWQRDFPENVDLCSTHPVAVLPLRRAPSVLVLWTVTQLNGDVRERILEERDRAGRVLRRIPIQADDITEDRVTGDVVAGSAGFIQRYAWPSFDPKGGPISVFGRQSPSQLAANDALIVRLFGGAARVFDAATSREAGQLTVPPNSYALSVIGDDDGRFWLVSTSRDEPFRPAITLYNPLGGIVASWSMEALGARPGVRPLSGAALDVRLPAGRPPEVVALLADESYRVYHYAACDVAAELCTAPGLRTGANTSLARGTRTCPAAAGPLLAHGPGSDMLTYVGSGGQLIELDASGTSRLVGNITGSPLALATDRQGGAVLILRPPDAITRTVVARFSSAALAVGGDLLPSWQVPCDCTVQPVLAADSAHVYVGRALQRHIAVLDLATGAEQAVLRPPTPSGLWPIDVAVTADGWLWTADVANAEVQGWPPPAASAAARWPAGFLASPWRLSSGALADGTNLIAVQLIDGTIEIHQTDGNVVARLDPQLADRFRVGSHVLGPRGRVYVLDLTNQTIRLYEPRPAPPSPAVPAPTPTPSRSICLLAGDKVAGPQRIILGQTAAVTLTLAADCPPQTRSTGADIVLVLDDSSSMNADNKIGAAVGAATEFATFLDTRLHRLALVTFNDHAALRSDLTHDAPVVIRALDGVLTAVRDGGTDIAAGVAMADDLLARTARPGALGVIVLLSDGQSEPAPALARAMAARDRGVRIYTIGLGADADHGLLIAMASGRYFPSPSNDELFPIYREILRLVGTSLAGNLTIDDEMGPDVRFEPSSSAPPAIELGDRLRWGRSILSTDGITLTYRVRPLRTGIVPTNRLAVARYTDADGVDRSFTFPVPAIEVIAPTPTAMPPSPTPAPGPIYLPVSLTERCTPVQRRVDVALVLDASTSMAEPAGGGAPGTKIDAARAAARLLLDALRLDLGDQAAIVTFNAEARVVQDLTDDRARIEAGLGAIVLAPQTRPQRGIAAAVDALSGAQHRPANARILVLLTDGRSNPEPPEVGVEAAAAAKAAGHVIFTVALGTDVDTAALKAMASEPAFAFQALDGAALGDVFVRIAGAIPCPGEAFWGRR